MESIEEKLRDMLAAKLGVRPELTDGLAYIGVDSVGMAELTVDIEKEFGILVGEDIVHTETVQELVDYVRARQSSSAS